MRVPLSWLREMVPVELGAEELGELLSLRGIHLEQVLRPWAGLEGVVTARVLEVRDHPASDTLVLARVDFGAGEREVVAGVRNMRQGDVVPLAGPGTRVPALPEPLTARKIRGVVSDGMLCSPRELAISQDHGGILVLPADTPVGADFKQLFGLDEAVLDLEVEANRPDLLGVLGVAREVAAATGVPLTPPDASVPEGGQPAADAASVEVLDREKCPRYLARVISGVTVGSSPVAVQARLTAAGMRPVSNAVDATNYVMLEVGQPMHPFDLARLDGRGVIVRRAAAGEHLVTLDGVDRALTGDDLVIADRSRAVGIAGVMGSEDGEVAPDTTEVLLESAYFERRGIMRTSRRLGLQTEASSRFSKGADPEVLGTAAARAARLMTEWSGGTVLAGAIDVGEAPARRWVALHPDRATRLLGYEVTRESAAETLGRLGIPSYETNGSLLVEVPGHRPDLELEVDLIEDIVRLEGYENIPATLRGIPRAGSMVESYALRRRIRQVLVAAGMREALSLSFASQADLELMGDDDRPVRVANPPSGEEPYLRTSLIPNLLRALARNASGSLRGAALFEVGHVFQLGASADRPVEEREAVTAVMGGPVGRGVHAEQREFDFFDAKGVLEALFASLPVEGWSLGGPATEPFHPGRSATVLVDGVVAGSVGELHPSIAERLDLPPRVALFELDADVVAAHVAPSRPFREISKFPPVHRDLAFVVPADVPAGAVLEAIREAGGDLVSDVVLFDVFTGPPIPEGKKSLAFSVEFRAPDRTLTDDEAGAAVDRIVRRVAEGFGGELRTG
jgi:phenylalanyl-tRNA synthetase beta chain